MQKKHLALALALCFAAPLAAQAADFTVGANTNITLSGLFAVGGKISEVTNTSRPVEQEKRFDDNTSRLVIAGNTDLGDGLKVIFRIESRFTSDTRPGTPLVPGSATTVSAGTGWADGDTWVGLGGKFGSVYFGKSTLYYADTLAVPNAGLRGAGENYRIWDANGLSTYNMLSQVGTKGALLGTLGITRAQNMVRYDSPVVQGFDGSVAFTKNAGGDENKVGCAGCTGDYTDGATWYGRVRYNGGPVTASLSVFNTKVQGNVFAAPYLGPMDKTGVRAGLGYYFPSGLKLGVVYDKTNVKNGIPGEVGDANRGVVSLPVSYFWGKHGAHVTYTRAGNTSNVPDSGATQLNLVYDYALAKNAFVGLFLTQIRNEANGTYAPFLAGTSLGATGPRAGENFRQLSANINFWF